jgi:hypothetical protein
MYMKVSIQRNPVGKGLTTHITDFRTLSCMYITMSVQRTPSVWRPFLTHYGSKDALQYIHDDEYSGSSF